MTFPFLLGVAGGGTVGCLQITRHLRQAGAEVTLLLLETHVGIVSARGPVPESAQGREHEAALREMGVEILRVPPARHYALDPRVMRGAVARRLEKRPVDAVLGWHHEMAALPAWLRARGVLSGVFAAGRYEHLARRLPRSREDLRNLLRRRVIRGAMRSADLVFAISEYLKRDLMDVFALADAQVKVAPWGVAPIFFRARPPEPEPVTRILFYGSAAVRKGIPDALKALSTLAARGERDWTLRVVAWRREEVEALADEHGIRDRVELLEPMPQEALVEQIAWAQVAVLPSTYESFGLACAECQAGAVPVIAYDVGGVGEVVANGESGWLVPVGDVDAIAGALAAARSDPERTRRMGLAGRERAEQRFRWEHTARIVLAEVGRRQGATTTAG
ncbi:MAG: glycosyltransferase family 4 protein [Planctomycetota bacterium]